MLNGSVFSHFIKYLKVANIFLFIMKSKPLTVLGYREVELFIKKVGVEESVIAKYS